MVADPADLHEPVKSRVDSAGAVAGLLAQPQSPRRIIGLCVGEDVEDVHDHCREPDLRGAHGERIELPNLHLADFDIARRVAEARESADLGAAVALGLAVILPRLLGDVDAAAPDDLDQALVGE